VKIRYSAALLTITLVALPARAQYHTQRGAGLGGLTGAVVGGAIGHQNDETIEGVLIGGAVGALAGGMLGRQRDMQDAYDWHYYYNQQALAAQYAARAVSVADIVTMSRNGLSDAVIVQHIQQNGLQRQLTVQDIVGLHQAGVSENVIQAAQQARGLPAGVVVSGQPATTVIVGPPYRVATPYVGWPHLAPPYPHRCYGATWP
jgi:hypothetical protein